MNGNYPSKLLENAVEAIGTLPGIGRRSALRLAMHILRQPPENVHHFTEAIVSLRDNVKYCRECRMISDTDICAVCSDRTRDRNTICVVQSVRDVMSIEATGQYHGLYHVLGGVISPINGIGPSDLTISELVTRISDHAKASPGKGNGFCMFESSVSESDPSESDSGKLEIILALSGDVEGETTSFYIYRQISQYNVKVTSLARGLGFGDDLEYADELTLGRSITGRQPFHP